MVNYICPICDRKLAAGNYCTLCKKVVRKPIVYNGNMPNQDSHGYTLHHEEMANRLRPGQEAVKANTVRTLTAEEQDLYARNANHSADEQNMHSHYSNATVRGTSGYTPSRRVTARNRVSAMGCLIYFVVILVIFLMQLFAR